MFSTLLLNLKKKAEAEPKEPEYRCEKCGASMVKRADKYREGEYWFGCSNYPECKHTVKDRELKFKKWRSEKLKKVFCV